MIAQRDQICPGLFQGPVDLRGDALAMRGVLTVDDGEICPVLLFETGQFRDDGIPPAAGGHITQKQYFHGY